MTLIHSGVAQAGASKSITLAANASEVADFYKYRVVKIVGGTGAGQVRNVVGSRKNWLKNNAFVGAVAGVYPLGTVPTNWTITFSGSGITREIVGCGVIDGKPYIDVRFYGQNTSGSTLYPNILSSAATPVGSAVAGMTFTFTAEFALIAGAFPTSSGMLIREYNSAGAWLGHGGQNINQQITGPILSKLYFTYTMTKPACSRTGADIILTVAAGQTFDVTLRVANPQLEIGATSSEHIMTPVANPAVGAIIDTAFDPIPDATSQYEIHEYIIAAMAFALKKRTATMTFSARRASFALTKRSITFRKVP